MHLDKEQARELWNKYLNGSCSDEERRFVETWYNQAADEQMGRYPTVAPTAKRRGPYYMVAAIMIAALALGLYFYIAKEPDAGNSNSLLSIGGDIQPGGNKAVLALPNGQHIQLS